MKLAVIGVYYAPNLGDAIICDCVAYWIKKQYPHAEVDIVDIEGKTAFPEQHATSIHTLYYRQKKLQWDYWLTRRNIKDRVYYWNAVDVETRQDFYDRIASGNYDAAIFAGGQIFMDWLSVDVCEFLKRFEKAKTPVFFNACGTGLSVSDTIQKLLAHHLQADTIKLISSRDDVKKIEDRYLDGRKKAVPTYDPALWVRDVYLTDKTESNTVGLGVMYSTNYSIPKLAGFWIRLIKELNARNITWKFFCNGDMDDYNFGCYVLRKLGLSEKEYIYDYPKSPEELIQQITSFESLISFRLHSHIIAASFDIPAVAIVWDEKLRFFYRHLRHEERCLTIQDSADAVLLAHDKAKREGYCRSILDEQKEFSRKLLLDALGEDICCE